MFDLSRKVLPTRLIPFVHLGEYRLHTHTLLPDESLSPGSAINCAIRNREEILTERLELHRGEELHFGHPNHGGHPLLKLDREALWAWMLKKEIWYPVFRHEVALGLNRHEEVHLKWPDSL